jgi:hypothetical protein
VDGGVTNAAAPAGRGVSVGVVTRVLAIALAAIGLAACTGSGGDHRVSTSSPVSASRGSSAPAPSTSSQPAAPDFLQDAPGSGLAPNVRAVRSRAVMINAAALLTSAGHPRDSAIPLTLNLFPDVTYSTTLRVEASPAGVVTWTGPLEGIAASSVTVVRTSGVFIVKVASPEGVFEISNAGGQRYRLDELDPRGGAED